MATTEYAGVVTLVALVLGGATSVAAPDLPETLAHHVRVGLCIVGGDGLLRRLPRAALRRGPGHVAGVHEPARSLASLSWRRAGRFSLRAEGSSACGNPQWIPGDLASSGVDNCELTR